MRFALAAVALVASVALAPGWSQTLSGVRVGDKISSAPIAAQKPIRSSRTGPFNVQKWKLEDGNELSVTSYANDGRIVYAENDWNGEMSGAISDFDEVQYGSTTLADLVRRFGSKGIIFKEHLLFPGDKQSLVRFNTYYVDGQPNGTVTFASRMNKQNLNALGKEKFFDALDKWKVESIIIAEESYLEKIWGNSVSIDSANRPIIWETPR